MNGPRARTRCAESKVEGVSVPRRIGEGRKDLAAWWPGLMVENGKEGQSVQLCLRRFR